MTSDTLRTTAIATIDDLERLGFNREFYAPVESDAGNIGPVSRIREVTREYAVGMFGVAVARQIILTAGIRNDRVELHFDI